MVLEPCSGFGLIGRAPRCNSIRIVFCLCFDCVADGFKQSAKLFDGCGGVGTLLMSSLLFISLGRVGVCSVCDVVCVCGGAVVGTKIRSKQSSR